MKVENKTKITTKDIALEPSSTKSLGTKGSFKESALSIEETTETSLYLRIYTVIRNYTGICDSGYTL